MDISSGESIWRPFHVLFRPLGPFHVQLNVLKKYASTQIFFILHVSSMLYVHWAFSRDSTYGVYFMSSPCEIFINLVHFMFNRWSHRYSIGCTFDIPFWKICDIFVVHFMSTKEMSIRRPIVIVHMVSISSTILQSTRQPGPFAQWELYKGRPHKIV